MSLPLRDVYEQPTLADLLPSVIASAGAAGEHNRLELTDCARTVVLLVDGMDGTCCNATAVPHPF